MNEESTKIKTKSVSDDHKVISIVYTNYRGEMGIRHILPKAIRFASTDWHPEPQWLLEAFDLEKKADRSFAMKDISEWRRVSKS